MSVQYLIIHCDRGILIERIESTDPALAVEQYVKGWKDSGAWIEYLSLSPKDTGDLIDELNAHFTGED